MLRFELQKIDVVKEEEASQIHQKTTDIFETAKKIKRTKLKINLKFKLIAYHLY